ncbi:MAG TPA: hypothetical protein DF613_17560 [Lachnospiraceae bacterium]|nr:hypothetical protein [Lachnospiraceae bacterium]
MAALSMCSGTFYCFLIIRTDRQRFKIACGNRIFARLNHFAGSESSPSPQANFQWTELLPNTQGLPGFKDKYGCNKQSRYAIITVIVKMRYDR